MSDEYREACLAEFISIGGTWYHRYEPTGEIIETSVWVGRTEEWARRPQAKDRLWCAQDYDGITIAVKVLV